MDIYAILSSGTEEFESEADKKAWADECRDKPRVMISVEGYNTCTPEDDIKKELSNHFKSCGKVVVVIIPKDPEISTNLYRRAFIILMGHGAEEKAMQRNGTNIGGWNAIVKVEPEQEDEESANYRLSLINEVLYDPKFWYGVSVKGYNTSLPVDEIESCLRKHFGYCGEITHVYVNTADKLTNIYFPTQQEEAKAMDLDGTKVGGFKLNVSRVPSVLSETILGNGQIG